MRRRNKKHHHKRGRRGSNGRATRAEALLLDQPVTDWEGTVPCKICGHPVDPKRLHFHMVRFHGAALHGKPTQGGD